MVLNVSILICAVFTLTTVDASIRHQQLALFFAIIATEPSFSCNLDILADLVAQLLHLHGFAEVVT